MIAIVKPVAAISLASLSFFAPRLLAIKFPDPCPQKKPTACIMAITANTTPTAAVACVLIFPTK